MRPRPPKWALAAGLPKPEPNEEFRSYWERIGISAETLNNVVAGLGGARDEVANERMACYLAREMPDAYQRFIMEWAAERGVRVASQTG